MKETERKNRTLWRFQEFTRLDLGTAFGKRQSPSSSEHCSSKPAPEWLSTSYLAAGVGLNLLDYLSNLQRI
jgi:hypothetical protein